jgi:hypothetical protein
MRGETATALMVRSERERASNHEGVSSASMILRDAAFGRASG